MKNLRSTILASAMLLGLCSGPARADADTDSAMLGLATRSGCPTCHSVEPGATRDGKTPIGPAWRDVAAKYAGDANAQAALTRTVLEGSSPYASHWKGKVTGLAMPPNQVAIGEADAAKLVGWILSLNVK
ncbi:MAG: c-type cytochrome [Gammaproteobacteria bacterium]|jgi:cytochrome c|nr:c-type cytochrome [Gammaproteobacteria bacterium]MBU0772216.1 c-type cytochrome [Gammaproteobacteria bacterium]MBU0855279.1 c-type cytochrome [Gammaproteobacteria bacterium]MBU1848343.1 c-type cytochrome [Gammaproteobacteria bacterium]